MRWQNGTKDIGLQTRFWTLKEKADWIRAENRNPSVSLEDRDRLINDPDLIVSRRWPANQPHLDPSHVWTDNVDGEAMLIPRSLLE